MQLRNVLLIYTKGFHVEAIIRLFGANTRASVGELIWIKHGTLPNAARCDCTWPTSTFAAHTSSSARNLARGKAPQADLADAKRAILGS